MPDDLQIMIFNKKRLKTEIKRIWFHPKRWLAPPRQHLDKIVVIE
jgi:hypothetical protein|tara:strand:+ start:89 stop:223 length:135 start_codon:yes stop_codon:yes gene_type:complete